MNRTKGKDHTEQLPNSITRLTNTGKYGLNGCSGNCTDGLGVHISKPELILLNSDRLEIIGEHAMPARINGETVLPEWEDFSIMIRFRRSKSRAMLDAVCPDTGIFMLKKKNTMTAAERLLIDSYKLTLEGLAAYYGEAFEFVLHDLTDYDHSIIKIINGHHSGRTEGDAITDFALSMLEQMRENGHFDKAASAQPYTSYFSASKYGKPIRSTTIIIFGEKDRAIGLLCINLYLDSPLSSLLQNFSMIPPSNYAGEHFSSDSGELIARTVEKIKKDVEEDISVPQSLKNKEIVVQLYHQGIFKLKDAVMLVSRNLGISKNTVYLHIRSLENRQKA